MNLQQSITLIRPQELCMDPFRGDNIFENPFKTPNIYEINSELEWIDKYHQICRNPWIINKKVQSAKGIYKGCLFSSFENNNSFLTKLVPNRATSDNRLLNHSVAICTTSEKKLIRPPFAVVTLPEMNLVCNVEIPIQADPTIHKKHDTILICELTLTLINYNEKIKVEADSKDQSDTISRHNAAKFVKFKKHTLDYYETYTKWALKLQFDFLENWNEKFGILKTWVESHPIYQNKPFHKKVKFENYLQKLKSLP